jgi:N-acetylglutamate synthase-like GNAT family acetyltransferase
MRSGAELDVAPPLELERLAGGELLAIRSAEEDDAPLLRDLVADYAQARRRGRHLGWMGISHRVPRSLQPLTAPAEQEECLLAIEPRSGRVLGMASISRRHQEHGVASPWLLVRDGFRRRGIGTVLLEHLAVRARLHEYERFRVRVVVSEQRMLELMRGVGAGCRPFGSLREIDADVPIPGEEGLGVALGAALWAVARGGLVPMLPER